MKKALVIIAIILTLSIGALIYFATHANSIIAKQKPAIEETLSNSLGAKVSIGDITVSAFPGISAAISSLSIHEPTNQANGQSLNDLRLSLKLLPLLRGALVIDELSIIEPTIKLQKSADGIMPIGVNLSKKKQNNTKTKTSGDNANTQSNVANSKKTISTPLNIELQNISIENATIIMLEGSKETRITGIHFSSNVELISSLLSLRNFSLSLNLLDVLPVSVRSQLINIDLSNTTVASPNIDLTIDDGSLGLVLSELNYSTMTANAQVLPGRGISLASFNKLSPHIPALAQLTLKGRMFVDSKIQKLSAKNYASEGNVSFQDVGVIKDQIKLSNTTGNVRFKADQTNRTVSSDDLNFLLGEEKVTLQTNLSIKEKKLNLTKLALNAFGGTADITLETNIGVNPIPISTNVDVKNVDISRFLLAIGQQLGTQISGNLQSFTSSFSGTLPPSPSPSETFPLERINGAYSITLLDGNIKNYNLARDVLGAITELPFMKGSLADSAPEEQRAALQKSDTALKEVSVRGKLQGKNLSIEQLNLLSDIFSLIGDGKIVLDTKTVALEPTILFNPVFSAALADSIRELRPMLDKQGRLPVPLEIRGQLPALKVLPNTKELLKTAAAGKLKEEASKVLGKALGIDASIEGGSGSKKGSGLGGVLGF